MSTPIPTWSDAPSLSTVYIAIVYSDGKYWNTSAHTADTFNNSNSSLYKIPLTDPKGVGKYTPPTWPLATMPVDGLYSLIYLKGAGTSIIADTTPNGPLGIDNAFIVGPPNAGMTIDGSFTVSPLATALSSTLAVDTDIVIHQHSTTILTWTVTDSTGAAVNLSSAVIRLITWPANTTPLVARFVVESPAITVSGTGNNVVAVPITLDNTVTDGEHRYVLWNTNNLTAPTTAVALATGRMTIKPALLGA